MAWVSALEAVRVFNKSALLIRLSGAYIPIRDTGKQDIDIVTAVFTIYVRYHIQHN